MRHGTLLASICLAQSLASFGQYIWPAKTDDLEEIIFNDSGFGQAGVGIHIQQCGDEGRGGPGAQIAATWLRTTYHDMITHVGAEGAGGVDASITFETDRMENIGIGFNNTFLDLLPGYSTRVPMADLLAGAAYFALRKCKGPALQVRAGRIDAHQAGTFGAPDPTETFNVHMHKFARAARNQTEMIMMIACGHSIGGVHGNDFPTVTQGNADPSFTSHFDSTFTNYDHHVALDFISANTTNPLASGPIMSQSDFRIFSSDNNITITRMATLQGFHDICQQTITKMIDTVPDGVTLTEIIEPTDVKPFHPQLTVNADGSVHFDGQIRVHTSNQTGGNDLDVSLLFTDRSGKKAEKPTKLKYLDRGFGLDFVFDYYDINADLPNGVSKFDIQIGNAKYNNGGDGFQIHDHVVFQQAQSSYDASTKTLTVYGAVSNDLKNPNVKLEVFDKRPQPNSIVPALVPDEVKMTAVTSGKNSNLKGYTLFKGTYQYTTEDGGEFGVAAYVKGDKRFADDYKKTTLFNTTTNAN